MGEPVVAQVFLASRNVKKIEEMRRILDEALAEAARSPYALGASVFGPEGEALRETQARAVTALSSSDSASTCASSVSIIVLPTKKMRSSPTPEARRLEPDTPYAAPVTPMPVIGAVADEYRSQIDCSRSRSSPTRRGATACSSCARCCSRTACVVRGQGTLRPRTRFAFVHDSCGAYCQPHLSASTA